MHRAKSLRITRLHRPFALWLLTSSTCALSTRSQCRTSSSCPGRGLGSAKCFSMNQHGERDATFKTPLSSNDATAATPRPYKSFLEIMMDDSVLETLHSLTQQIISSWENMESNNTSETFQLSDQQPPTDEQNTIEPQERPKLKIKPRSLQSLHMTYFFMGIILDEMTPQQVTLWNSMLQQKLCTNQDGKRYALKFKGFETFPPYRRDRIVATFESSEHLDELYEELCDLAMTPKEYSKKRYEFPKLGSAIKKELTKRRWQRISPWVGHVTLADIVGGRSAKKSGVQHLSEWLNDQQFSTQFDNSTTFVVQRLDLGGTHPQKVDLDWSFPLN